MNLTPCNTPMTSVNLTVGQKSRQEGKGEIVPINYWAGKKKKGDLRSSKGSPQIGDQTVTSREERCESEVDLYYEGKGDDWSVSRQAFS